MFFNDSEITKENILDNEVFEKVFTIENKRQRDLAKNELLKIASSLKMKTAVEKKLKDYGKIFFTSNNVLDFGEDAPIRKLLGGEYSINADGGIVNYNNKLVCAHLILPVARYINVIDGQEKIECAFKKLDGWHSFITDRSSLLHNGKIVSFASKSIDVSTNTSSLLVKYLQDILNLNEDFFTLKKSINRLGWYNDQFIPYDKKIVFDGEDCFQNYYNAVTSCGDYNLWLNEMYNIRKNVIVRLAHATSLASVLLRRMKKKSFVTMIWGTTGDGKTVAAMSAMSFWGNPKEGYLTLSLNNTDNFYFRAANFFYDLPVLFDELETYRGDINKLIMNITEGIDRGKAKADGGIENNKTWNNAFIMTGEHTASDYNSGGGTLNRLIEIESDSTLIEDGAKTVDIITQNYGFAGKIFIDQIKKISDEQLKTIYQYFFDELLSLSDTAKKQATNMALLLLADTLACTYIFTEQTPLLPKDVAQFLFTKEDIDISKRAYEVILDECSINKNKFYIKENGSIISEPSNSNEFWGNMNEYSINISKVQLDKLLRKNGFSFKKTMMDWNKCGYIEKKSNGKFYVSTSVNGIKGYYIEIKK